MSALSVALVFGGRSSEHSISCISAAAVWSALESAGHRVIPIAVTPKAGMVCFDGRPEELRAPALPQIEDGARSAAFVADPSVHGVLIDGVAQWVDVVFPVLHGPWGEDGTIQGLLELAGIPYVGSGVLASAMCMDKITVKTLLRSAGIPVAPWVTIDEVSWREDRERILANITDLASVVFVKPSRAGSSMGISRIAVGESDRGGPATDELVAAIESARRHDPRVMVEQAVLDAREIECGVRQLSDGVVESSVCAQIQVREGFDFYDFDAKYLADGAELLVPAPISTQMHERLGRLARECFRLTGCEGLARVDFFVSGEEIVVNELNTMPGFTPISMYPRMWEASGVSYSELIDSLVAEAHSRKPGLR